MKLSKSSFFSHLRLGLRHVKQTVKVRNHTIAAELNRTNIVNAGWQLRLFSIYLHITCKRQHSLADDAAGTPIPESYASSGSGRILEPLTFDVGSLGSTSSTSPNFEVGTPPTLSVSDDRFVISDLLWTFINAQIKITSSFFAFVLYFLLKKEKKIIGHFFSLMKCIFCDEHFNGKVQFRDDYLRHLLQQHKFVIGDFKTVPDFRRYETVRLARRNHSYS